MWINNEKIDCALEQAMEETITSERNCSFALMTLSHSWVEQKEK
jgi:hypothetical protein